MKILLYIVGIIAALFFGFLLVGVFSSDLTYDYKIEVEKSVEETWAVVNDEGKMAEWLPGFIKVEHVSGSPGSVGAVSNVYFDEDGQEMIIKETITEIIPNESISMAFESEFMNMDYKLSIASSNGKTKINSFTTVKGNGMISASIIAFIGSAIKEQEEKNLVNLKKTIEKNKKVYFSKEDIN